MRVCKCPNCGTIITDNPYWRPSGFKWGIDFTSLENFTIMFPDLAETIKTKKWVEDELYIYHISRNQNVSRAAKLEYDKKSFMSKFTDSPKKTNPWVNKFHVEELKKQTKLVSVCSEMSKNHSDEK